MLKVRFNGLIARGRQLTHNPKTYLETYKVGRWHNVQRQLPLKGTPSPITFITVVCLSLGARPPMKVYTDMDATITRLDANGGIGLEPVFCQVTSVLDFSDSNPLVSCPRRLID